MNANDNPTPNDEWVMPPQEPETRDVTPPRRPRFRAAAKLTALVAASVVVGSGASYVLDHRAGSTASAGTANAPSAFGRGNGGPTAGAGGGIAGEQHVQGAVTAKTSSTVTVRSSSGTGVYTVDSTSQVARDGQPATLAEIQVGDAVLVHVYPSSGRMLVERLFAGTLEGGSGGFGPPASSDDSDGSATT